MQITKIKAYSFQSGTIESVSPSRPTTQLVIIYLFYLSKTHSPRTIIKLCKQFALVKSLDIPLQQYVETPRHFTTTTTLLSCTNRRLCYIICQPFDKIELSRHLPIPLKSSIFTQSTLKIMPKKIQQWPFHPIFILITDLIQV